MRYSKEVRDFIAENVKGKSVDELVGLVNKELGMEFTKSKMSSYMKNHGLKNGMPSGNTVGMSRKYPDEIKEFISENHINTGHQDMADLLNKTFGTNYTKEQIKSYYARFKLNSGLTGYFPKGHVPFNKGKKGVGGWEPTQFKKGHMPHNHMPVGSERVNGDDYIDIKIADPNKWKGKHILIWEEHNGPVPKGNAVIFGDGNRRNFDPNNLILVSRHQLLTLNRNRLIQNNAEGTKTALIITDIYHKISDRKKNKSE